MSMKHKHNERVTMEFKLIQVLDQVETTSKFCIQTADGKRRILIVCCKSPDSDIIWKPGRQYQLINGVIKKHDSETTLRADDNSAIAQVQHSGSSLSETTAEEITNNKEIDITIDVKQITFGDSPVDYYVTAEDLRGQQMMVTVFADDNVSGEFERGMRYQIINGVGERWDDGTPGIKLGTQTTLKEVGPTVSARMTLADDIRQEYCLNATLYVERIISDDVHEKVAYYVRGRDKAGSPVMITAFEDTKPEITLTQGGWYNFCNVTGERWENGMPGVKIHANSEVTPYDANLKYPDSDTVVGSEIAPRGLFDIILDIEYIKKSDTEDNVRYFARGRDEAGDVVMLTVFQDWDSNIDLREGQWYKFCRVAGEYWEGGSPGIKLIYPTEVDILDSYQGDTAQKEINTQQERSGDDRIDTRVQKREQTAQKINRLKNYLQTGVSNPGERKRVLRRIRRLQGNKF